MVLCEVYPAGEAPIEGADSSHLADAVAARGGKRPTVVAVEDLKATIERIAQDGDIVVTMGAGSIGRVPSAIAAPSLK